jgi:hypothetical protein
VRDETPAYRWRKEKTSRRSNEVEVAGSNPAQGLDSLYYYYNQPELPRQLDEQTNNNKVDWLAFKDYLETK